MVCPEWCRCGKCFTRIEEVCCAIVVRVIAVGFAGGMLRCRG